MSPVGSPWAHRRLGPTSSIGGPAVSTSLHETASSSIRGKRLDESIISNRHNAAKGVSMGEVDPLEVVRSENEWQDGERIRRSVGVIDCRPTEKDVLTQARSRGYRVCVEIGVVWWASLRHASCLFSHRLSGRDPPDLRIPSLDGHATHSDDNLHDVHLGHRRQPRLR